jgi:hypothetical protein
VRLYRAPTLRPVTVFGKSSGLAGFYDRLLHNGAGRFITSEDLARMNLYDVSDALRALPGIYVHRYGGFRTMLYGRLTIPDGGRPGGGCPAVVLLDGRVLPPEADINVWVDPRQVAGIEVYPDGASAPTEYRVPSTRSAEHEPAMAGCSVIGFWTRRKP